MPWSLALTRLALRLRLPFSKYLSTSIAVTGSAAHTAVAGTDLFPAPLPHRVHGPPRPTPGARIGPARPRSRRQGSLKEAHRRLENLLVVALNYVHDDFSSRVPVKALRRHPNPEQVNLYARLEVLARSWLAEGGSDPRPLGKNSESMYELAGELDALAAGLHGELNPTAGLRPADPALRARGLPLGVRAPSTVVSTSALAADRLKYPADLQSFDLSPHLRPDLRMALLEPASIQRREIDPRLYPWSKVSAKSWKEVSKLLAMWLPAGKLFLTGGRADPFRTSMPFNGAKSAGLDRQLLDQRGINGAEQDVCDGPSALLPAGFQYCDVLLGARQIFLTSAYDLAQCYDTVAVSPQRARRNRVGPARPLSDFAAFEAAPADFARRSPAASGRRPVTGTLAASGSCWVPASGSAGDGFGGKALRRVLVGRLPAADVECRDTLLPSISKGRAARGDALHEVGRPADAPSFLFPPPLPPKAPEVAYGAFAGLAQGDSWAVDIAQGGHMAIVQGTGFLRPDASLRGRHPCPDKDITGMMCIDDVAAHQRFPQAMGAPGARRPTPAADALATARAAVIKAGATEATAKRREDLEDTTVIGAELLGRAGLVGAPRARRRALACVTFRAIRARVLSWRLLQLFVSSWTTAFMYRRPLMAVFDQVYKIAAEDRDELLEAPRAVFDELLVALVLAPLAATNMRAYVPPRLWCTDASPWRGASCSAPVPAPLARGLWRHGERKAKYSKLDPAPRALLRRVGALPARSEEHDFPEDRFSGYAPTAPREIAFVYDVVLVCDGAGRLATACARRSLVVGPVFDLSLSPWYDLLCSGFLEFILFLVLERRLSFACLAPPCTTCTTVRQPALRSAACIHGFNPSDPQTEVGNILSLRSVAVLDRLRLARLGGLLEFPRRSMLVHFPSVRALKRHPGVVHSWTATCGHTHPPGGPAREDPPILKELGFLLVRAGPHFLARRRSCPGGHVHKDLGSGPDRSKATRESSIYAPEVCSMLAEVILMTVRDIRLEHAVQQTFSAGCERAGVNDLLLRLPWTVDWIQDWPRPGHINLLESAACRSWEETFDGRRDVRPVAVLDSRVTLCSSSKGRSPAAALRGTLRRRCAQLVGRGVYPSYVFGPTRLNTADPPTRFKDLEPPIGELPSWAMGSDDVVDFVCGLPPSNAPLTNWARIVLHLVDAGALLDPGGRRSTAFLVPGWGGAAFEELHTDAADPLSAGALLAPTAGRRRWLTRLQA